MEVQELIVGEDDSIRLDTYVSEELELSRSRVNELVKNEKIFVNNDFKKASYKVKSGDIIRVNLPEVKVLDVLPEDIYLDIIYEDDYIIVINKPKGMIVHPSGKIVTGTLVNALLFYSDRLSDINGVLRPGIVHRLDKDTSGVIIVAKTREAHIKLQMQFQDRTIKKHYIALVNGGFKVENGEIIQPIDRDKRDRKRMAVDPKGRFAHTKYNVLESFGKYSLLNVQILTGRTHQIRVHMAYIKHPIVGDIVYSSGKNEFNVEGQLLHSETIEFIHPITLEKMFFKAEIPKEFNNIINRLKLRKDY